LPGQAEAVGRTPVASRCSPNMEKHFLYGSNERLKDHITAHGQGA